jgi:hypothetical protein
MTTPTILSIDSSAANCIVSRILVASIRSPGKPDPVLLHSPKYVVTPRSNKPSVESTWSHSGCYQIVHPNSAPLLGFDNRRRNRSIVIEVNSERNPPISIQASWKMVLPAIKSMRQRAPRNETIHIKIGVYDDGMLMTLKYGGSLDTW